MVTTKTIKPGYVISTRIVNNFKLNTACKKEVQ